MQPSVQSERSFPRTWLQRDEAASWLTHGIVAGALGAFVVALFFFVLDFVAGRPLWTPTALGAAVFLGEIVPRGADPSLALIAGYTAIHGFVFAALGIMVAVDLTNRPPAAGSPLPRALVVAGLLFVVFEAVFLVLSWLSEPVAAAALETGPVAAANGLAAVLMAAYLLRMAPGATTDLDGPPTDEANA